VPSGAKSEKLRDSTATVDRGHLYEQRPQSNGRDSRRPCVRRKSRLLPCKDRFEKGEAPILRCILLPPPSIVFRRLGKRREQAALQVDPIAKSLQSAAALCPYLHRQSTAPPHSTASSRVAPRYCAGPDGRPLRTPASLSLQGKSCGFARPLR